MPYDTALVGEIAGVISFAGFFPYVQHLFKHGHPPQRTGWLIWSVVGGLLFFSYWFSGATHSLWVPALGFIGPFGVWLLSLKYGIGGWEREDQICLAGAAISLVAWVMTGSPVVAMALSLVTDGFGSWLIIRRAYAKPGSESRLAWVLWTTANTLNLFAIPHFTLIMAGYPAYAAVVAGVILASTFRRPNAPSTSL